MFFKAFTTTCFTIALTSSAVSASSAVTQEDAMPTATKDFLSQTMTEGGSGGGGFFGPSKVRLWDYFEANNFDHDMLVKRNKKDSPANDAEKIKLIASWGGEETEGYKQVTTKDEEGDEYTEYRKDTNIIATVDKASQKWASDTMQRLAREIKYLIKDTDCAEAAEATTAEQRQTFAKKFRIKLLSSEPTLKKLLEPFDYLGNDDSEDEDEDDSRSYSFDQAKAAIKGVAGWNDSPFQFEFEKVLSLQNMKSALLSTNTIILLSSSARGKVAKAISGTKLTPASIPIWWANATFITMFEAVCQVEYQAWGSPNMSFFPKKAKK